MQPTLPSLLAVWHNRHVALTKATLAIYAEESELLPNRVVLIDTVKAVDGPASASHPARFEVRGVDGLYFNFGCRTEADKVQWVDSVRAEIEGLRTRLDSVPFICVDVNSDPSQPERVYRAYVFLLSGRLALTPVDAVPAKAPDVFDAENSEHRKHLPSALGSAQLPGASHIVFLPPQVTVEDENFRLDINWPPPSPLSPPPSAPFAPASASAASPLSSAAAPPPPRPAGSGVRLDFTVGGNRSKLVEWRNKIKEARKTNLTSKFLNDPDFAAAVHEAAWSKHFLPQASAWSSGKPLACPMLTPLWALFYDEGAESKSRRDLLNEVKRVFDAAVGDAPSIAPLPPGWSEYLDEKGDTFYANGDPASSTWDRPGGAAAATERVISKPVMQSRAIAFVALLEAFVMAPSVRALFLAFPMTERATASTLVADFVAHGRTLELRSGSAAPMGPAHVVGDVCAAFCDLIAILRQKLAPGSDWDIIVKKIFLHLVSHPAAGGAVVSAAEESSWFFNKAQDRRKVMPALTYECLTTFLEPAVGSCVRRFVQIAVREGNVAMRTILDSIDHSDVISSLREDRRSSTALANPIIEGLLAPNWEASDKYAILIGIVLDFDLLNGAFWQAFVRAAFTASAPKRIVQFLDSELFVKHGYYYNVATAGHFNNYASTLVEELDSALNGKLVEAGDSSIAVLIEMALRFEHLALETPPELRLFVTLGRWRADVPEPRSELLHRLLSRPGFLVAFASVCGANAELMDVPTDALTFSTGAAAVPSRSATVLGPLVGSAKERRRQHLLDSLFGFMATAAAVDKARTSVLLANFLGREEMSAFFASYFSAKKPAGAKPGAPPSPSPGVRGQLRDRFVEMLSHEQMLKPAFKPAALSGDIFLSQANHFRPDALALLGMAPQYMSLASFLSLIEVAMKLGQYKESAVTSLDVLAMRSEVGEQLDGLFKAVKTRRREDFFPGGTTASSISLDDIGECAASMVASKSLLVLSPNGGARLQRMFAHILEKSAPATWRKQMCGSTTIAFFIKYLDREDLAKAYAAFASMERNKAQSDLLAILEEVRAAYPTPVVATKDLALDGNSQVLDKLMADIAKTGAAKPNTPLPLGLLWRITAEWMKISVAKVAAPMAPRNVQSIAFLLCAAWARRREGGHDPANRTLIAQVGTGEGKSLLIAMLALFSVVELKKRVIILESNKQLLSRDREEFIGFFQNFGIETTEQLFDPAAMVTYCLRSDIEHEYRKRMFRHDGSGGEPFADTVLVVDEVDSLIIDAKPAMHYVTKDYEMTPPLIRAYEALRDGKSKKPDDVPDEVWADAKAAKAGAEGLFAKLGKANGVRLVGSEYVMLDERCDETNLTSKELIYLNFVKCGKAPSAKSVFFVQSRECSRVRMRAAPTRALLACVCVRHRTCLTAETLRSLNKLLARRSPFAIHSPHSQCRA